MDLNNDGFDDLILLVHARANGADYQYFLYSKKEKKYVCLGVFPELVRMKKASYFESDEKISREEVEHRIYKLEGDKLNLIEYSGLK